MEVIELSQKEIRALLTLMDELDFENVNLPLTIPELVHLHSKLSSARTY